MPTPQSDDWRRQGQERYLLGAQFTRAQYHAPRSDWDHDHCEFCHEKFSEEAIEGAINQGYRTCSGDQERWVCPDCFEDFREEFGFTLAEGAV